jgi:hypothetical protein
MTPGRLHEAHYRGVTHALNNGRKVSIASGTLQQWWQVLSIDAVDGGLYKLKLITGGFLYLDQHDLVASMVWAPD